MPIDLLMPQLSPTMTEGRLARWSKKEGDKIRSGDVIAEVETDKATMEVEATTDGILHAILQKAGEDVLVGAPIGIIRDDGETVAKDYQPTSKAKPVVNEAEEKQTEVAEIAAAVVQQAPAQQAPMQPQVFAKANTSVPATAVGGSAGSGKSSPVARRIAAEKGIAIDSIIGTGPNGVVTKKDAENAQAGGGRIVRRPDSEEKLAPMRKTIASRLTQSKQQVPHFYLTTSVMMDDILKVRQQINSAAATKANGEPAYKVSVNDLIIKACAMAIAKHPAANAGWAGDTLVKFGNVDISVAVSIDGGLVTPVLQNADQKSIVTLSNEMKTLAQRAREGKLKPEEYEGGSFSISNLGMYGIESFTAIINPPQPAILAVGRASARPVVNDKGALEIAQVMDVTMSVDHRVIDGALGAELVAAIKFYLENPAAMLV